MKMDLKNQLELKQPMQLINFACTTLSNIPIDHILNESYNTEKYVQM